jgi:DNA polymerase-2
MKSANYYILTTEWQDINDKNIIRLCVTGDAGYAEIIISNKPVFFVKRDVPDEDTTGIYKRKQVELKNFSGEPLDAVYFNAQSHLKKLAADLEQNGHRIYESDIDPVRRYLMEKSIYCSIKVTGETTQREGTITYTNPLVEPANYFPELKIASIDIETGAFNKQLYCIGIHLTGGGTETKVIMVGEQENTDSVVFFKDEQSVLSEFFSYLEVIDPDVITGWHVIGFDLAFLEQKCIQYGINFKLGRTKQSTLLKFRRGGGYFASVGGRLIIDAPSALRSVFYSFDDFKLETVAQEVLGEGKLITPEQNKVDKIEKYFLKDKLKLAEYNLQDAVLVNKIIKKTGLIDLLIRRSVLSGLVIEQAGMMTAAFDHFYLPKLHKKGYAASNIKDVRLAEHAAGGYVMDPRPGIYENVVVLDFKSLYPSIIMTFKIDPLSRLKADENPIMTPVNIKFSTIENILPDFIKQLMDQRTEAKKNKNKPLSIAIKLLMNSFYGVMGSSGCRFYHSDLPNAITGTGQWLLLGSRSYLEQNGYTVLYGDTDSLFVALKENEADNPVKSGEAIALLLNDYWQKELKLSFNAVSFLEIEFEKFYRKFILTPVRGTEVGAKKRYAGLIQDGNKETIEFTGMESIRSDWTKLAKEFQAELYRRIFSGSEVDEWIKNFTLSVKQGLMDEKLIYRKRIRKNIEDYKNLPPQIKAAKMSGNKSSVIKYVITLRGPVPVEMEHKDIDYQHYIDKQLKPIADSVLTLLGKSFESIINPFQFDMFR